MTEPDDDFPEVFAMAYLDEEYPPKSEEYPPAALMVEYDAETKLYCYEVGIGVATAPTLQEAVEKGIDALYKQQPIPVDKCPFCEAPTRPGDRFCLNCGEKLPQS